MVVYRICSKLHSSDLSGTGAFLHGGRWNKIGDFVLYTASQRSLACLEILVHVNPDMPNKLWDIVTIYIPDELILDLSNYDLGTHKGADGLAYTRNIGTDWIKKQAHLTMKVPSSIIQEECNYIINCAHPLFRDVKILEKSDFEFDKRLIKTDSRQ